MWQTREDVINDLREQSGGFYGDFDNFIVQGEKPPPSPYHLDNEEDEFRQRLGCGPVGDDIAQPDYAGITHMLRMVDAFDGDKKEDVVKDCGRSQPIIITKLNPYVNEFVPKSQQTKSPGSPSKPNINAGNPQRISPSDQEKKTENNDQEKKPEINDRTKMVSALHKTIGQNKGSVTMEQKRARNVALATLLKLHSAPSTQDKPDTLDTEDQQGKSKTVLPLPVLCTPEYFAGPSSSPKNEDTDKPPLLEPKKSPSPNEILDPEIKKSVSKVENWLNPEKKKPKPGPWVSGPIIFKKKCSPNSTPPVEKQEKVSPQKSSTNRDYVPSKYAEEYRREMAERVKAKEEKEKQKMVKNMNIWDKLEYDLKERDEAYRSRLLAQSADSSA